MEHTEDECRAGVDHQDNKHDNEIQGSLGHWILASREIQLLLRN